VLAALIVLGRGWVRGVPLPFGVLRWERGCSPAFSFWGSRELRVFERMGALWMGIILADPGGPVPVHRAQRTTGFVKDRLKAPEARERGSALRARISLR
jgi:hypothetical protein